MCYAISSELRGEFNNYAFLESLWYKQSENRCSDLHRIRYSRHFGFLKMAAAKVTFLNISASIPARTLMLTSKPPFLGPRNLMVAK